LLDSLLQEIKTVLITDKLKVFISRNV